MKLSLAIQCISTWDFSPIEDEIQITINGLIYQHTVKRGGYRIIAKPIPDRFTLGVKSKKFLPFEMEIANLAADKIVLCEMNICKSLENSAIYKNPVQIEINSPAFVVLGYDYYRVDRHIGAGQTMLRIINPRRSNLEGRRFLLHDTKNEHEELIILGDALDVLLTDYKTAVKNDYNAKSTVLLSAFFARNSVIDIRSPPDKGFIWVCKDGQKRKLDSFN